MALAKYVDRLTRHAWTPAEVEAMAGEVRSTWVAHASSEDVRGDAASGGVVSALLIALLESGEVDGALVCVTSVEDGRVRARYRIATTRDEVLAARGSTYVLGEFAREGLELVRGFEGRVAVVALPCEIALVRRDPSLAEKVTVSIALFCGHTTEPLFLDRVLERLSAEAGGSPIVSFRFRRGHWRGRLHAELADGTVVDRPAAFYLLYHNLYYGTPKKCLFCGDHFGYGADISVGDIWSQKYKNDPIKHSALIVKTERGAELLALARAAGQLEAAPASMSEVLDGQRRTAPFHYNVSARAQVGERLGLKVPDKVATHVRWHDRMVARMAIRNHLATRTDEGSARVVAANRRWLKLRLYAMKGLESLPTGPLVPAAEAQAAERAPRFSLIAVTITGNRGAEAMLATSVGRIRDRYPDAQFSVYSYYPVTDRRLVRDPSVTIHSSTPKSLVLSLFPLSLLAAPFARLGTVPRIFPRSVRDLAASRALVDLAGVSFIDGREKFLPFNILTILPAMLLGTPVFKLAQAMGPFKHPLNRVSARLLRHCALVVPRGAVTREHLEQIAFPPARTYPAPDVAFLFRDADALSLEGVDEAAEITAKARALAADGRAVVGLCPSAVIAGKAAEEGWDYIGFMASLARGLLADGHAVALFPNATRAGSEKLRNNDLPVIAQIAEKLGDDERVLAVRGDMNAASLRVVLRACSCAAVSRFHAMVGSLAEGVPVAVVGWSHKYLEIMEQFGLGEYVFDYSAHDADALRVVVNRLVAERDVRAEGIRQRLPQIQAESLGQYLEMFRRLES